MAVVVIGGGVAGLASALALARAGRAVTVLERDATPLPATADAAFVSWTRRGAPQVHHSHAFLARLRNLLAARAPDVLTALLEAGASELRFVDGMPETVIDRTPRPGDDELVALACRRTTFEWVLRRVVQDEPGVTVRDGVTVEGLAGVAGRPPRVTGVRAGTVGDPDGVTTVPADLVVDAGGPRTGGRRWLAAIGADQPPDVVHECGIVYLSRFYRLCAGAVAPATAGPAAADLGYLKFAVFVGDNGTFSVTLAVDANDAELRSALTDPARFEAAARAMAPVAPWLDGRAEAVTDVHVMAGLRNRKRILVTDGEPVALGYLAVGDASVCTNPLYGRGCTLATVHAFALADVLVDHPDDPVAAARAFDAATTELVDPWFENAVFQDAQSRALAEADPGDGLGDGTGDFLRQVMRDGLRPALRTDPEVFRAFLRWFNLLSPAELLVTDQDLIARVFAAYEARHERPAEAPLGPDRDELVGRVVPAGR